MKIVDSYRTNIHKINNLVYSSFYNILIYAVNKLRSRNIPFSSMDWKIRKLHNIHTGKKAVLLGSGPSVKIEDFSYFLNYVTFACNRFHLCYHKTDFRPDYTVVSDLQMDEDFGDEIELKAESAVIICLEKKRRVLENNFFIKNNTSSRWFDNPMNGLNPSGSTLLIALQLAYYMGIRDFLLYGVDHSFTFKTNEKSDSVWRSAIGDDNHFIDNYRSGKPWCPPDVTGIELGFKSCETILKKNGGSIINISRHSELPVIPRIPFDSFFS